MVAKVKKEKPKVKAASSKKAKKKPLSAAPRKTSKAKTTKTKTSARKTVAKKTTKTKKTTPKKTTPKTLLKKPTKTKTAAAKQVKPQPKPMANPADPAALEITPYQAGNDESYMNEAQRQHFRNILETWKRELMEEVDNTISEMKEATVLADPNDRATQEEAFSLELRTRDRERKLLKKIEEALQKIDEQDYGYCESCGIDIGVRRLEARPTATLCIDCKTLAEIKEKRA